MSTPTIPTNDRVAINHHLQEAARHLSDAMAALDAIESQDGYASAGVMNAVRAVDTLTARIDRYTHMVDAGRIPKR